MAKDKRLQIRGAILSYPSLEKRSVYDGKEGKFGAKLYISKSDVKMKAEIDSFIAAALADAVASGSLTTVKDVPKANYCLRDGDESGKPEQEGYWIFSASSNDQPTLVTNGNKLYAGCIVNAIVSFWVQGNNNKYGKRVNSNLLGVQFRKDGKTLGREVPDVSDDFDAFDEDLDDEL